MISSESIAKLAPALVAAQAELRSIGKDSRNPDFGSKYVSLDKIVETVRPILAAHGLALLQGSAPGLTSETIIVETRIVHTSGEWVLATVVMPLVGRRKAKADGGGFQQADPQSGGSALTYGRRYGISALLCLSTDEDDDGNAASRPPAAKRSAAPRPEPTSQPKAAAPSSNGDYHGPAHERPMPFGETKGQTLASHSTAALRKVKTWCLKKDDAKFGPLVKDITAVLADRQLTLTDDDKVNNMKAGVAKESSGLPF